MGASSPAMASGSSSTSRPSMWPEVRPMDGQALQATDRTVDGDLQLDAKSFRGITKVTRVRQFYVDNLRGHLDATLAAAKSTTGAVYPPGSVIQLVPGEAMVKRDNGFNTTTHDWEFFELDVSKDGTQVRKRGFADVVNRFGGDCLRCPASARPQLGIACDARHWFAPN